MTAAAMAHRVLADWVLSGALVLFVLAIVYGVTVGEIARRRAVLGGPPRKSTSETPRGHRPVPRRPGSGGSPSTTLAFRLEVPAASPRSTEFWGVFLRASAVRVGQIGWFGSWRQYVFTPAADAPALTAMELREIAGQTGRLTGAHNLMRERRKGRIEQRSSW